MNKEELYTYIGDPDALKDASTEMLKEVVTHYPYFHTARLLFTKHLDLVQSDAYQEELGITAVLCADRRRLFYLIYRETYQKLLAQSEESQRTSKDRTEELLDAFLASFAEEEKAGETAADEVLPLVSGDYLAYLASTGEEPVSTEQDESQKLQYHDIIDAFIEKASTNTLFAQNNNTAAFDPDQNAENEDSNEFLTETLARIYIKQKKYAQALTIIKRLNLNFPKKSIYFADQIRFLEYLIMNEQHKNQ